MRTVEELARNGASLAERQERGAVNDLEKPRAHVADVASAAKRVPRAHERVLQRILGGAVAHDSPRVREQLRAVALDDDFERPLVFVSHELGEALVARARER